MIASFQKYNWALTAVTVLTSSFLVAKATNYIVEEKLIEEQIIADHSQGTAGGKALAKKTATIIQKNGDPIVDRNLFNSNATTQPATTPASGPTDALLTDAPGDCTNATIDPSGATIRGTIVASPKEFSNITVSENGTAGTSIYWVGDKAFNSDAEVYEVHARKVFFKRATGCTYLILGEAGVAKPVVSAPPVGVPPTLASADAAITTEGISKTGENSYEISRDLINSKLSDLATLTNEAKAIPNMKNGEFNGFKLYAIRSTSVFSQIGMKNGDILQTVNGEKIDSLEKAMGLLGTLGSASSIQIGMQRRGQDVKMDYSIK
jgi:type II secretory pathway component PulC